MSAPIKEGIDVVRFRLVDRFLHRDTLLFQTDSPKSWSPGDRTSKAGDDYVVTRVVAYAPWGPLSGSYVVWHEVYGRRVGL